MIYTFINILTSTSKKMMITSHIMKCQFSSTAKWHVTVYHIRWHIFWGELIFQISAWSIVMLGSVNMAWFYPISWFYYILITLRITPTKFIVLCGLAYDLNPLQHLHIPLFKLAMNKVFHLHSWVDYQNIRPCWQESSESKGLLKL